MQMFYEWWQKVFNREALVLATKVVILYGLVRLITNINRYQDAPGLIDIKQDVLIGALGFLAIIFFHPRKDKPLP